MKTKKTKSDDKELLKKALSNNIKVLLEQEGIRVAELARRMSLSDATVRGWVYCTDFPQSHNLEKLSLVLGVTPAMLLMSGPNGERLSSDHWWLLRKVITFNTQEAARARRILSAIEIETV